MNEPDAVLSSRRRISAVWIVPVVAMLLGAWMVVNAYLQRGPVVEVSFSTAEGLVEDTTTVQVRNVEVGLVTDIALSEDLGNVVVTIELADDARPLLREDTQFWVVRPRVSSSGISGLGTIVSGAYIELAPGVGSVTDEYTFRGLEQPPSTPAGTPGLRIFLVSATSNSIGIGDPVLYRGYPVGRVEQARLDVLAGEMRYSAFIDAPYDDLVSSSTRFWNASGIFAEITAEGATVSLASLETLITGGVAFDLPETAEPGGPVEDYATFQLHPNEAAIDEDPHRHYQDYVVSFSQSVRGLSPGAPVAFRGITAGSVRRVMIGEGMADAPTTGGNTPIPVLIRLEPGRLAFEDSPEGVRQLRETISRAVAEGLRGTLDSASLLTGSLYVNLEYFRGAEPGGVDEFEGLPTIPTVSSGFGLLQQQLSELMTTLNELPLQQTLDSATGTLEELQAATRQLNALLADEQLRNLPSSLDDSLAQLDRTLASYSSEGGLPDQLSETMTELDRTLESVRTVVENLERNPSSIIFPGRRAEDPQPRAGAQ